MTVAATRTIGVVTVGRSDYGHLRPVLAAVRAAPDLTLQLFVAGMHLSPRFGQTVDAIVADGWPITARVEMLEASDTPEAVGVSIGRGVGGFSRVYAERRPDLLVVLGDRFEMLAAAAAALPFALPVTHLHGGEASEGAIDNQIRHAITKLSHLHLVSADAHARRVEAMGEERWRIHTVGAPGLDRVRTTRLLSRDELARRLGLPATARWLIVTYHPVTLEYRETAAHVDALVAALEKTDASLLVTYPNADTAGSTIIERLEEFAGRCARVRLVRNLGDDLYLSMLAAADAMVGNSSSGLIEAPSFALPVVNVGRRQQGRLRGANVLDVGDTTDEILVGLEAALAPGARERLRGERNPYGDGHAAERIVRVLREVELGPRLVVKREVA
jgi:GDP/UDP-N,N'-diacetylbacillosamine 2-epimerase (hydrolysing)